MSDIDQIQSMLEATVSMIKDVKENPGEHSEELLSHMETKQLQWTQRNQSGRLQTGSEKSFQ